MPANPHLPPGWPLCWFERRNIFGWYTCLICWQDLLEEHATQHAQYHVDTTPPSQWPGW